MDHWLWSESSTDCFIMIMVDGVQFRLLSFEWLTKAGVRSVKSREWLSTKLDDTMSCYQLNFNKIWWTKPSVTLIKIKKKCLQLRVFWPRCIRKKVYSNNLSKMTRTVQLHTRQTHTVELPINLSTYKHDTHSQSDPLILLQFWLNRQFSVNIWQQIMVINHTPLFFRSRKRPSFLDLVCPVVVSFTSTHKTISNVPVRRHKIL